MNFKHWRRSHWPNCNNLNTDKKRNFKTPSSHEQLRFNRLNTKNHVSKRFQKAPERMRTTAKIPKGMNCGEVRLVCSCFFPGAFEEFGKKKTWRNKAVFRQTLSVKKKEIIRDTDGHWWLGTILKIEGVSKTYVNCGDK